MTSASDIEIAADFVALAIDPAVPFTRAVSLIANRVAEIRDSASPSITPACPLAPPQDGASDPRQVTPSLAGEEFEEEIA